MQAERDDPIRPSTDHESAADRGLSFQASDRDMPRGERPIHGPDRDANTPQTGARPPVYTTSCEVESLGVSLGPALHDACGDRLGDIEWFRSPWQQSGAATGLTAWRLPNGRVIDAIVKAPVGYREYFWSTRLGEVDPMWWESDAYRNMPVPRVVAEGTELGGYDIAWIVQERIAGQTVTKLLDADRLRQLFFAAARFHAHTRKIRPAERTEPAGEPDWREILDRARTRAIDNALDRLDEWLGAIDAVDRLLPALLDRWHARPMDTWCHGDLHPGNVMIRDGCSGMNGSVGGDPRCAVLIDFSLVHAGHWVEDALYLERMYWGHEGNLQGIDPVRCLAEHRALLGLHADESDETLADVRRLLMGVTSPAFLRHENEPVYLAAALDRIRSILPTFGGSL